MVFIPGVSTIKADPQSPEENAETYAESQQQRALERKLREEKRELEIMKAQGAPDEEIRAQRAKVRRASSDIDAFCDETGRTRRRANEYTPVNASWEGAKVPPYGVPVENVTYEYRVKSKPNSHEIIEQPGYKQGNKHEEVPVANRIKETFGGEIILHADEKKPHPHNFDYIWNGKNWELKTPETFGGIDKLIHKSIHQIEENPGGIIVDCKNLTEERAEILRQVFDRISRSASYSLDIIMLYDDSYRVYKYKKR